MSKNKIKTLYTLQFNKKNTYEVKITINEKQFG